MNDVVREVLEEALDAAVEDEQALARSVTKAENRLVLAHKFHDDALNKVEALRNALGKGEYSDEVD